MCLPSTIHWDLTLPNGIQSLEYAHLDLYTEDSAYQPIVGEWTSSTTPMPEPGTLVLMGLGLLGVHLGARMRKA